MKSFKPKWNRKRKYDSTSSSSTNNPRRNQTYNENQFKETEVGIEEYVSKLDGFFGIIKARFSDFHVNEVDIDGNVAILNDSSVPDVDALDNSEILQLNELSEEKKDEISKFLLKENPTTDDSIDIDVTQNSRDERTNLHKEIRQRYGSQVVANTVNVDDKKLIRIKKQTGIGKTADRIHWQKGKEYVHFLLYKESMDTLTATLKLGDCLKTNAAHFYYAGVKDKRAKTTQWFSVHKIQPKRIVEKTAKLPNLKVGNFFFKGHPLKLGDLKGNKFRIALRNVTGEEISIQNAMDSLRTNGFINYYGLQRFGNNKDVPTFLIGQQLLLGNWKEACTVILKPTQSDDPILDVTKAKNIYHKTGNVINALEAFRNNRNSCIEYKLLYGMKNKHANDYVTALEVIPRNVRLLYLHSFQSYIWNKMVSKRISTLGLKPVEGDLVLLDEEHEICNDDETNVKQCVKTISTEELTKYTIFDVVLPLPGYKVTYPENMKVYYREILEEYGLTLEMPKQKVATYSLTGNYRKILGTVNDFSWKMVQYSDPYSTLIRSDRELLEGILEPETCENGEFKAIILEFILQSSSYATMVLRELLKSDTSSSVHAKFNNYHERIEMVSKKKCDSPVVNSNDDEDVKRSKIDTDCTI